jgi:hypothetical protein
MTNMTLHIIHMSIEMSPSQKDLPNYFIQNSMISAKAKICTKVD